MTRNNNSLTAIDWDNSTDEHKINFIKQALSVYPNCNRCRWRCCQSESWVHNRVAAKNKNSPAAGCKLLNNHSKITQQEVKKLHERATSTSSSIYSAPPSSSSSKIAQPALPTSPLRPATSSSKISPPPLADPAPSAASIVAALPAEQQQLLMTLLANYLSEQQAASKLPLSGATIKQEPKPILKQDPPPAKRFRFWDQNLGYDGLAEVGQQDLASTQS
jgi:hypothetical protein